MAFKIYNDTVIDNSKNLTVSTIENAGITDLRGNVTVGPDGDPKITLDATDGSAEFAGGCFVTRDSETSGCFVTRLGSDPNSTSVINAGGDARFNGKVSTGTDTKTAQLTAFSDTANTDNTSAVGEFRSQDASPVAGTDDINMFRLVANTDQGYTASLISLGKYEASSPARGSLKFKVAQTSLSSNLSEFEFRGDGSAIFPGKATFAGSVSIGGTDAAHTMDEYEEGIWNVTTFETYGTLNPIEHTVVQSNYTIIGNMVFCQAVIAIPDTNPHGGTPGINLPVDALNNDGGVSCSYRSGVVSDWANGRVNAGFTLLKDIEASKGYRMYVTVQYMKAP